MLIGIIVLAVLVVIVSWSWLREVYYGYEAESAFSTQLTDLRGPLNTLGFRNINSATSICRTETIAGYSKPQLNCASSLNKYVVIGTSLSAKNNFVAQANKLDQLLKQYGWTEDKNVTPTIAEWFEGITSGKDYYPDDGAYLTSGNTNCSMDFFVAYSNPGPPAFNLAMGCSSPVLKKYADTIIL